MKEREFVLFKGFRSDELLHYCKFGAFLRFSHLFGGDKP